MDEAIQATLTGQCVHYQRRRPEETNLYQLVHEHVQTFFAQVEHETEKAYGKPIRQVAIMGHGKFKPALIITNDFDLPLQSIIRKYARRWLVEQQINEQTQFFHLNRVCSHRF